MHGWILPLKLFAYLTILLMAAAVSYAAFITLRYWPAISV